MRTPLEQVPFEVQVQRQPMMSELFTWEQAGGGNSDMEVAPEKGKDSPLEGESTHSHLLPLLSLESLK